MNCFYEFCYLSSICTTKGIMFVFSFSEIYLTEAVTTFVFRRKCECFGLYRFLSVCYQIDFGCNCNSMYEVYNLTQLISSFACLNLRESECSK